MKGVHGFASSATSRAAPPSHARIIGQNDRTGFLGEYQPVVHYLNREEFEQLAGPVTPERVPVWR